jgi:hypothetical protein
VAAIVIRDPNRRRLDQELVSVRQRGDAGTGFRGRLEPRRFELAYLRQLPDRFLLATGPQQRRHPADDPRFDRAI